MIPLFRPKLPPANEFLDLLRRSEQRGMLTNFGPCYADAKDWCDRILGGHCLPVTNGTVAIEVALFAEGVRKGERVGVPDFTFSATAQALHRVGAIPVILPCRYSDCGIDFDQCSDELLSSLSAVICVAPFGYEPDWETPRRTCAAYGLKLIWDLAGAWPMRPPYAATSTYSFHAAKSLAVGEGGLVRFHDREHYNIGRRLISFSFDEEKQAWSRRGFNGKIDEVRCAILAAQLQKHSRVLSQIEDRWETLEAYEANFAEYCDPIWDGNHRPSLCVLRGLPAQAIVDAASVEDIVCRRYYHPLLSEQPAFAMFMPQGLRSDERLKTYIALPSSVKGDEFGRVVDCVLRVCHSQRSMAV